MFSTRYSIPRTCWHYRVSHVANTCDGQSCPQVSKYNFQQQQQQNEIQQLRLKYYVILREKHTRLLMLDTLK